MTAPNQGRKLAAVLAGPSQDVVIEELRRTLDEQLRTIALTSTRAITLLSVMVGTLAATITLEKAFVAHPPLWGVIAIVVAAALVISAVPFFFYTIFSHGGSSFGILPESMVTSVARRRQDTVDELIRDYLQMTDENEIVMRRRYRGLSVLTIVLLAAATLLISTSIALYLVGVW